jgi:hypothetical protein
MEELVFFGLFGGFAVATGGFAALWVATRRRARRLEVLVSRLATPEDQPDSRSSSASTTSRRASSSFAWARSSRQAGREAAGARRRTAPSTPALIRGGRTGPAAARHAGSCATMPRSVMLADCAPR